VTRCAKAHALLGDGRIRPVRVVGATRRGMLTSVDGSTTFPASGLTLGPWSGAYCSLRLQFLMTLPRSPPAADQGHWEKARYSDLVAYSVIVRSLEKRPDDATFTIAFGAQLSGSRYAAATRAWRPHRT